MQTSARPVEKQTNSCLAVAECECDPSRWYELIGKGCLLVLLEEGVQLGGT